MASSCCMSDGCTGIATRKIKCSTILLTNPTEIDLELCEFHARMIEKAPRLSVSGEGTMKAVPAVPFDRLWPWCPYVHPNGELCAKMANHRHVDHGCGPEIVGESGPVPEHFKSRVPDNPMPMYDPECTCTPCPVHGEPKR